MSKAATEAGENIVLAVAMFPEELRGVCQKMRPRDMPDEYLAIALSELIWLHKNKQAIDPLMLSHRLELHPTIFRGDASPKMFLAKSKENFVGTANLSHYIDIVKANAFNRDARHLLARYEDTNGMPLQEKLQSMHADIDDLLHGCERRSHFHLVTARELADLDCQVEYRIPGVMANNMPLVMGGPKKGMKTTALCDLAISIASGGHFFGYFKVAIPGRVLFISGESGIATIKETCNRICDAAGQKLRDLDILFCEDLPRFSNAEHIIELGDVLARESVDVLIVDPAGKAMSGENAGNLFSQYEQLEPITKVCQDNETTFVLAHHAKSSRAQPFAPLDLDDLSWSGFAEHFRQWILLNRREAFEPGSGEHRLWLGTGGSAGHHGLWGLDVNEGTNDASTGREWHVKVLNSADINEDSQDRMQRAKEKREAEQLDADMKEIVAAMVKFPESTGTKTDIKTATGIRVGRLDKAIAQAFKDGHIETTTIQKGNQRQYEAIKLKA